MNLFDAIKQSVTTRQAAETYGIRVGRNGMCICPFHNDRTPSMKVDRRFHCFGCQADGDVIDFTSRFFGLSGKEAAEKLAADFGISYESVYNNRSRASPPPRQKEKYRRNSAFTRRRRGVSGCTPIISIFWRNGK